MTLTILFVLVSRVESFVGNVRAEDRSGAVHSTVDQDVDDGGEQASEQSGPTWSPVVGTTLTEGGPFPSPEFRQSISLAYSAGLPSVVTLTTTAGAEDLREIRVLFVLDGRLLAVPMRRRAGSLVYLATFPTPATSLHYQIQFIRNNGTAFTTKQFTTDLKCPQRRLDRALASASDFPNHAGMLRQAAELEQEFALLDYLSKALNRLRQ